MYKFGIVVIFAIFTVVSPSPVERRGSSFSWGVDKIRGANIGGWLVLEPWITPSIFEQVDQSLGIVDEYTLCEKLPMECPEILRQHWDSWVSPSDFQKIASSGINIIRIPIGYWAYDNRTSPYVRGAAEYLHEAIGWARNTNPPLKVMIDLHGAPGSQNGFDNSGQRMPVSDITWLQGGMRGKTAQKTINVLSLIANQYGYPDYADVVVGIELLNEPMGPRLNNQDLRNFYHEGYHRVRRFGNCTVVLQDAFLPPSSFNGFLTPWDDDSQYVAMDHHYYQVFDDGQISMTPARHDQQVCDSIGSYTGSDKWAFIGEWSGAMTDCAKYLNGYRVGARYDGTYPGSPYRGSCAGKDDISTWTQVERDAGRRFIEAQLDSFEDNSLGWIFWNFKTEGAAEWDMFAMMDYSVFPNPVTSRAFPRAC